MLNLDWNIIWTVFNLLVLFLLLKIFLFKPVTRMMDQRAKAIADSIENAEAKNREADAFRQQYADQLAQAEREAAEMIKEARNRAGLEYDKILQNAHTDADRLIAQAEEKIQREREAALRDVQQSLAGVVLLAAAKVAQKNIDGDSNRVFVDSFLSEAGAVK